MEAAPGSGAASVASHGGDRAAPGVGPYRGAMVERFVVRQMGALSAPQLLDDGVNRPVVVLIGADRFRGRGETHGTGRVQGEHVAEYLMQPEAARALARRLDELADEILGPETA